MKSPLEAYAEANLNDGRPLSEGGAMVRLDYAVEVLTPFHLEAIAAAKQEGREEAVKYIADALWVHPSDPSFFNEIFNAAKEEKV